MLVCDEVSFVGSHLNFAFGLTNICRNRDHTIVSVHVLQDWNTNRGVETSGKGEDNSAFPCFLICICHVNLR